MFFSSPSIGPFVRPCPSLRQSLADLSLTLSLCLREREKRDISAPIARACIWRATAVNPCGRHRATECRAPLIEDLGDARVVMGSPIVASPRPWTTRSARRRTQSLPASASSGRAAVSSFDPAIPLYTSSCRGSVAKRRAPDPAVSWLHPRPMPLLGL